MTTPYPMGGRTADAVAPDTPPDSGRLAFGDDVRLPWLEADDDEDDFRSGGSGRIAGLLVPGLLVLALALIGGGIWWATRGHKDALPADGSIITAPQQPYKARPQDPGGKTFAGTGDTSFAVSQGRTRPAKLGGAPETVAGAGG
ncbi:MAG: SPOR domain-containing protein, partial [Novosphingobium sp.]|nr:SPOR domain-containing protein [Novosphingobium sp.]